jgi:WD40 repeat protein
MRVWDAATGAERRVLEGHSGWVSAVVVSPDSRLIVSGSRDRTVRVWDAATGAEQLVLEGHSGWVRAVAVSPDSRLIVSSSDDRIVRVWDAATGAERQFFPMDTVPRHLSFSSCGRHLVTDYGILRLLPFDCQCSCHIFATRSWITNNGEDILYLHPDYHDSFGFLSGNLIIYQGRGSLQLKL